MKNIRLETGCNDDGPYVLVRPEGSGDFGSGEGDGWPVLIEIYEGKPRVIIWSDINQEDPTHEIDLSGALEVHRDNDNELR